MIDKKPCGFWFVSKKSLKGFTLTELALVLGVVGIILGAIWSAASAVYQQKKVNQALQQTQVIVQNIRALYATHNFFSGVAAGGTDITAALVSANVFPSDMIVNGNVVTPWGTTLEVIAGGWEGGVTNDFYIYEDIGGVALPQEACMALLAGLVGPGADSKLIGVYGGMGGNWYGGNVWPNPNIATYDAVTFNGCNAAAMMYRL